MKGKLWLLIPIITVIIVIVTIAFLYFQPQTSQSDDPLSPPQEKAIQYKDYLGKWIYGGTQYEEKLSEQGGFVIEIQKITDQSVEGRLIEVFKNKVNPSTVCVFSGRINGPRAEINYHGNSSQQLLAAMTLKRDRIGIQFKNDPVFKANQEILFNRVHIQVRTNSLQEILNYIGLSRSQIINKLGMDYKVLPSGIQGTNDGYYYPKYSVVIVFENDEKAKDRIAWVDCKEAININGVKAGSTFNVIRSKLGNVPLIETWEGTPNHKVYRLEYFVPRAKIRFQSESENGDYSKVFIIRM